MGLIVIYERAPAIGDWRLEISELRWRCQVVRVGNVRCFVAGKHITKGYTAGFGLAMLDIHSVISSCQRLR